MSSIQERLQLKRVPLDTWNIREQLCLASAVVRSGDQNWMSVSRALKTVGEANRPPDWYSQKSCAAQYGALLEHVETPKRKKRSSEGAVETPQESILKRLTQERIVEIQKTVAEMNQQYELLKNEITEARNPATSDDRLRDMWTEIEAAKRARERETARRTAWLKEREEKRARAERTWRPPHAPLQDQPATITGPSTPTPASPSSPLLTSLLKSSPVVTTPQHISHPANVVETVSPSAGAPTLSMLLEKSGAAQPPPPSPSPSPAHENKHAAIEHIKSQLVQIEQQLKANTAGTPPPALPAPAPPALDIDDIEIKAEDVYAFRDIDIHIPPVAALHKPARAEKPLLKKEEQEVPQPIIADSVIEQMAEEIKQEPVGEEPVAGGLITVDIDTVPVEYEEPSTGEDKPAKVEMRFPAPEIKVPAEHDHNNMQVKEEIKEVDLPAPEPEKEQEEEEEVNVEDVPAVVEEECVQPPPLPPPEAPPSPLPVPEPSPPPEPAPVEDQLQAPADPGDIPLPDTEPKDIPLPTEPPLPPEPELPQNDAEEEVNVETVEEKIELEEKTEPEDSAEPPAEEIKKDEEGEEEDSIPLKEMIREESARKADTEADAEVKEEPAETEEAHTETDDDTPMELSREEEKDGKKKRDYSRKKKPDSRTCSGSESAAEASAPESPGAGSATDAERQHRLWKKAVMLVYSRLCAHKYASIFLRPISNEEAPGYSQVVKRPMDLTTIRRNIEAGAIRTTAEFQRDVLQMLSNALMYNSSTHCVHTMAKEMFQEAQNQLGILLAVQAHAGLNAPPSPPAPPARRKRRRHDSPAPQEPPLKRSAL